MVLKLHGFHLSVATARVAVVLVEKKVPFEFVPVDISKGEHKVPEYLKFQPFGVVPYIDDDGFILYESRAICQYIEKKYPNQGSSLVPTDLKANALFEQASSIELGYFDDPAHTIAIEKVFKARRGVAADEAVYTKANNALSGSLKVYDEILSKQKYLAGDEITLADLYHLPWGHKLTAAGLDVFDVNPNVKRWWNDISTRPAWVSVKDGVKSIP